MSVELGIALVGLCSSLVAIIKLLINQNENKKASTSLETEVKLIAQEVQNLKDVYGKFEKVDEKFDKFNTALTVVRTQLNMLLTANGIKAINIEKVD